MSKHYRYKAGDPWRVVPFMLLGAILQAGLAIGVSAADSLFISNIGANRLPVIYAFMPLIMLGYIGAYSRLLKRWGIDWLFQATTGFLVVGGFVFAYLLKGDSPPVPVYYAAMFYGSLWYIALYSLLWNFIDGFFDLSEAKRLFGLIAGGSALGAIGGGFLVSNLSSVMGVSWLFGVWATTVLMALPVMRWIVNNVPRIGGDDAGEHEGEEVSLRDTIRAILGSRYVTVLTLVIFVMSLTATLCEYRYYTIFEAKYPDEAALAALFGQLYAAVNVFNLVVTMFLFRLMVRWIGVRSMALIQPVVFLAVFAFLLLDGGFGAALFGFLAFQGVMTSIEYNNQNLLFNVLPEHGKETTRTFIEGICDPVATAFAGIFLLGAQYFMSDDGISGIGFGAALTCLILVLVLRIEFLKSMTANVRRSWLDFSRAGRDRPVVPSTDMAFLQRRVDDPLTGDRERLTALERLWQLEPVGVVTRMLDWLPKMSPSVREGAGKLLHKILLADNPTVIDRCLTWAEKNGAESDAFVLEHFGRHHLVPIDMGRRRVRSANPADRGAGAVVLWESGQVADVQIALATIDRLLEGTPGEVEIGWHVVSVLGEKRFIPRVLPYLRSPDPAIRLRTLRTLLPLVGPHTAGIQPELLHVIATSRRPEERLVVIEAIERIGDSAIIEPLLRSLGDTVPQERRRLELMLFNFGPRAVPAVVKVLQGTQYPLTSRSIAARVFARVAFTEMEQRVPDLIDDIVRRAYTVVASLHVLKRNSHRGAGMAALALVYQDLPRLMLELALEFLSVIGRLSSFDSVVAALRAESGRDRGFALESIEQACGRQLFERFLPILDERPDEEIIAVGLKLGVKAEITLEEIIDRSMGSAFPMEASSALQAKVELDPGRVEEICLEALVAHSHPMVRMTARVLMRRSDPEAPFQSTVVEQAHELVKHAFFRNWGVRSLEAVAEWLEERWHEVGEVLFDEGEKMERFGVALEGGFRATSHSGDSFMLQTPSDFGRESLGEFLSLQHRTVVVTERARILWLPTHSLRACLQAQPRLAIDLLVWKLSSP